MIVVSLSQEAIRKFGEKSAIQKSCDKFSAGLLDGGGNISVTTNDFSKQRSDRNHGIANNLRLHTLPSRPGNARGKVR